MNAVVEHANNRVPWLNAGPADTPSPQGVRYEERDVDPLYAQYLLDNHNTHNRPLNQTSVTGYAHDMAAGKWHPSTDAIVLSTEDVLLNGQHRLAAVVKSGVTVRMLFGFNFPPEAQETMDAGRKRTFANTLSLRGETDASTVGAVTRRVWAWGRGERLDRLRETPTQAQLSDVLNRYPSIRESAAAARRVRLPIAPATLGLCHWLFSAIDAEACEFFFARLRDGANLDVQHPINVLRRVLIEQRTGKSSLREEVATAYVIKAWNAYRDGKSMKTLRIRLRGDEPEAYPEPR